MSKIIRHEFLGNRWVFLLLGVSVVGIPFAVLYLLETLVTVEEEMENPTEFLQEHRAKPR